MSDKKSEALAEVASLQAQISSLELELKSNAGAHMHYLYQLLFYLQHLNLPRALQNKSPRFVSRLMPINRSQTGTL